MLTPRFYHTWDDRRDIVIPGNYDETMSFCVHHFLDTAKAAIQNHGAFYVALSGGSTPKALFEHLSHPPYKDQIDWNKVHLFWSDERSVPPTDPDNNYKMAIDAGLGNVGIPIGQIHRMQAETDIEKNAELYEKTIREEMQNGCFDLIMLGMGEDGHTASLFPGTLGLQENKKLVVANHIPQKNTWRMTFTYPCIHSAKHIVIYVLGASKKEMVKKVLSSSDAHFPIQMIGTREHKALWICDGAAASSLTEK